MDTIINGTSALAAAISAFIAAISAIWTYQYQKRIEKKKFQTDRAAVLTQLIGFIDFVQYFRLHDILSPIDCQHIMSQVPSLNKRMIDTTNQFFYNPLFSDKERLAISNFLKLYMGWQGFNVTKDSEKLKEISFMLEIQVTAIDAVSMIYGRYHPSADADMEKAINSYSVIKKESKILMEHFSHAYDNFSILLENEDFVRYMFPRRKLADDKFQNLILGLMYQKAAQIDAYRGPHDEIENFLFNTEIMSIDIVHLAAFNGKDTFTLKEIAGYFKESLRSYNVVETE
ncbi:hypothetical protein [Acidaminococcus fermentans]|uniref:hypothetical protein n=1 Tax=Acidaminococcus fermentans TaxID=905 RepID=UPI002E7A36F6|nr:hypothetical protein [Acidaminococcus fermentans]MEE0338163.1 hypothetical protein [Acidaminococcus fermentans]